jgi:hypothetical protein
MYKINTKFGGTMKRLALIAVLMAAPVLIAARMAETGGNTTTFTSSTGPSAGTAEWRPIAGPADGPAAVPTDDSAAVQGLTVHEWGTFTSVAGPDGTAVDWAPAGGPTDLPCFVSVSGAGPKGLALTEQGGRSLVAKVRMETPVLYFYSPEEQTLNVKVSFPHGLITEWYPSGATLSPTVWDAQKSFPNLTGTIQWGVKVMPGATASYPFEDSPSHYYAARRTASAPVQAFDSNRQNWDKFEKFLFYRGIASFTPPVAAKVVGQNVEVTNLGTEPIPAVVLFENRGGKIRYRISRNLDSAVEITRLLKLNTLASLQKDLEELLRSQGMYALEARAMVDTWKDTWFEQGTRIFYIVPSRAVDSILPLEVKPQPIGVSRAFVGRMEVITPETQEEVRQAIAGGDRATLATYGRFLEPIVNSFLGQRLSESDQHKAADYIASLRNEYVASAMACSKSRSW